jgi:superfamily II DNA or RNA helicase/diadenosine tetraphosphate (Ap4A) HIT family hydrolase
VDGDFAETGRENSCPFCAPAVERVLFSTDTALAFRDLYPVSPGHTLVIPRRHAADWWGLTPAERAEIGELVERVKRNLDAECSPDGYNVGFNAGTAAGQTVLHAHVHVIPRFAGDVPDPRGGVRWVVPDTSGYLTGAGPHRGETTRADRTHNRTARLHDGPLRPLAPALADAVADEPITRADVVAAFVMVSGLHLLQPHLDRVLDRGGRVRLLTSDYLGVTEKAALEQLLSRQHEYGGRLQVRLFRAHRVSFHPKSYLLGGDGSGYRVAYTGSANVSGPGLLHGHEWTVETRQPEVLTELETAFERIWTAPESAKLTPQLVAGYTQVPRPEGTEDAAVVSPPLQPFSPTPVQAGALAKLTRTRADGFGAGLVVMATGLGKTWLAGFDSARPQFRRVLFLAHREEILHQTREVFRRLRPDASVGYVMAGRKDSEADIVLATVQTLTRRLDGFAADRFDYIVVDEFHHAAAASYRRVVNHFDPKFLLGLTATPDRADGADLLSLCEDNLVFECGLADGIDRGLLSPFHYQGVPDPVDFAPLPWRNSRFDPDALEHAVVTTERTDAALREWRDHAGSRSLGFCVSIRHADAMAAAFRDAGVRAAAVHTAATSAPRHESLALLAAGELDIVFSVDMFNEGVDLPAVDTVLLLRPTTSPVLFLQQIGRGLRLHPGKDRLTIVDFVGNHRSFLLPARILLGLGGDGAAGDEQLRRGLQDGEFDLPPGCTADYRTEALDTLLALLPRSRGRALAGFVESWHAEHGQRPTAAQAYRAGFNPAAAPGGWFAFLADRGWLDQDEAAVAARHADLLADVAATAMTKSYKMVALRAFTSAEALSSGVAVDALAEASRRLVLRDPRLVADTTGKQMADVAEVSPAGWAAFWQKWPLEHLAGGGAFTLTDKAFRLTRPCTAVDAVVLSGLIHELVDWRLARYLDTKELSVSEHALAKVLRNTGGNPILMLRREANPPLPRGRGVRVRTDTGWVTFDFMKAAVNIARQGDGGPNMLPDLLTGWFGAAAGEPGTDHRVELWHTDDGWHAAPVQRESATDAQQDGAHR